jgi:hypothetical protein
MASYEKMGITYEEKAFFDILVKIRDDQGFHYADEKCLILAKEIKTLPEGLEKCGSLDIGLSHEEITNCLCKH